MTTPMQNFITIPQVKGRLVPIYGYVELCRLCFFNFCGFLPLSTAMSRTDFCDPYVIIVEIKLWTCAEFLIVGTGVEIRCLWCIVEVGGTMERRGRFVRGVSGN